jgi:tetratricopeptide (TPR) repeat protein
MPDRTPPTEMSVDDYLLLAGRMLQEAKPTEALAALHQAELLDPEDAAVHLGLGGIHLHCRNYLQAIGNLEKAVALDPELALAHYHLGMARQYLNRGEAAVVALRQAVTLDPSLADAFDRLGDLLDQHGKRSEATDCFRHAAALAPATGPGRLSQAKALIAEGRLAEAESCLRQAIMLDPDHWLVHWMLGSMLSESGQFDAAIECFERTIALQPQYGGAYYSLISAKQITGDDRELIGSVVERLRHHDLTDHERMVLNFGLGKAYDDMQDYAAAIRHFDAANQIRRGTRAAHASGMVERVDRLIEHCTPRFFATSAPSTDDETPVLIVGMPRSGTTLVEQIISSHPRVGAGGELGFWVSAGNEWDRSGMGSIDRDVAARLATDYRALLCGIAPAAARVTDKQLYNFEWIGLILAVFPRARIIHCRRDPLDTCLSIYCTPFVTHRHYESDKADLAFFYRQYARLMAHWRTVVPSERMLEIDYETVVADRESATRRLIAFCGLDWDEACLRYEANPNAVRTASKWQVRQPIYKSSVGRWRRFEPWLGALRELRDLPAGTTPLS